MRVLVGTAGWVNGGRLERSRVRVDFLEEAVDERLGGAGRDSSAWFILMRRGDVGRGRCGWSGVLGVMIPRLRQPDWTR